MSEQKEGPDEGPSLPMRIVWVLTLPALFCQAWLLHISDERMTRSNFAALFALTLSWYALLWSYHYLVIGEINNEHPEWNHMENWQKVTMFSMGWLCLLWFIAFCKGYP
jgi:hypothetical protein